MNLDIEMKDMVYDEENKSHSLKVEDSFLNIKFFKGKSDFSFDLEYTVSYVSKIEKLIRTDRRYKEYKANLIESGFNKCAILGNIDLDKEVDLEMHHGPIFTLFDIVFIVLNYRVFNKKKISTFRIAKEVLDLHYKNMIQVMMLATTVHEQDHENTGFISMRQCCAGDIFAFLDKYEDGLLEEHRTKTLDYLKASRNYDTSFGDIFKLEDYVTEWN